MASVGVGMAPTANPPEVPKVVRSTMFPAAASKVPQNRMFSVPRRPRLPTSIQELPFHICSCDVDSRYHNIPL